MIVCEPASRKSKKIRRVGKSSGEYKFGTTSADERVLKFNEERERERKQCSPIASAQQLLGIGSGLARMPRRLRAARDARRAERVQRLS